MSRFTTHANAFTKKKRRIERDTVSAKSLWLENKNCNCHNVKAISLEGTIDATFPNENFIQQIVTEIIKAVVERLTSTVSDPTQILLAFSATEMSTIINPIVRKWVETSVSEGGTSALQALGLSGVEAMFGSQIPEIATFVDTYSARLVDSMGGLMSFDLSAIIQEGITDGDSLTDLTYRTRLWAGELAEDPKVSQMARDVGIVRTIPHRAELVARTEMNRAYNAGRMLSWQTVPEVVVGKMWDISAMPCEFCAAAGAENDPDRTGRITPVGEPFYFKGHTLVGMSGGLMSLDYETILRPPLHPNCRCTVRSVTRDDMSDLGLSDTDVRVEQ